MGYNGNCASTQQPITVNTYPLSPTANAGSDVTTTYISQGGTVNFNSNGSIGTSFGWDFTGNGSVDDTTANPTHNYTAAGTYNAILYVTLGSCTDADTIQIQVFNMVGLNERDSENMVLSVFPNPAKESITVNLKLTSEDDVTIRITNSVGEIVNFINRKKATLINENINIDSFASGVYFINVISTTESITKRVIIMD
jgi:PKD repeat protein